MARAGVALCNMRTALPRFADIAFPGYTLSGQALADLCATALHRPVAPRRMSWLALRLAAPVWPLGRHLLEMRYLWDKPHRLDPASFRAVLPHFVEAEPGAAVASAVAAITPAGSHPPRQADAGRRRLRLA